MKQTFMTIAALLLVCLGAKAQDEAMAVLTHGTTTKTFSGRAALINAYTEAVNGDLITLSSGQFESVASIEKAITIRGAGLGVDTIYSTQPTVIYNNITLAIPDGVQGQFQMEGIFHDDSIFYANNQKDAKFVKCRLNAISAGQYQMTDDDNYWGTCQNLQFFHCKIKGVLVCNSNSTMSLVNSYVESPYAIDETTSNISFRNCVIKANCDDTECSLRGCYLTNCVIYQVESSDTTFYYNDYTVFTNCLLPSHWTPAADRNTYQNYSNVTGIFKSYDGTYGEQESFELTDAAAAIYLGKDGKQVGMYGGVIPYTPRLAGPHIKTLQVSDHSSSDGKLNVKIQIENTAD